ncbi:MAG: hypothetical protein CMB48_05660 [Euryarchaeota archaeon]|nr:hypothetical protein [Euryarchaeota archaeon]|tara:strand:+ start:6305 stop:6982 length:678 start_codon:yes stop_codon:yes gene_type:complete
MTICAISQSNYIPWKGYFQLIFSADIFIFYDTVDFTKRDWRSRNQIMTPHGLKWLSIPISSKKGMAIEEVILPQGPWRKNHLETIRRNYSKFPFIQDVMDLLSPVFNNEEITHLSEFNQTIIRRISEYLEIDTVFHNASEFNVTGERVNRLIRLCEEVGADTYLSGPAAKNYITNEFDAEPLNLKWMEYGPYDTYQQHGEDFSHHISIVDTIASLGKSTKKHIFG